MDTKQQATKVDEHAAAARMGVSVKTLRTWRWRRIGVPYLKLGSRVVYDVADIDTFLASCRVDPAADRARDEARP